MRLLVIDTSTEKPQLIFAQGLNCFEQIKLEKSDFLFDCLQQSNFESEAVAVTIGPGSYTGIRIGLAAAKGIALPGKLPLIGLCSLSGFVSKHYSQFLSLIDARGGGVYLLKQKRDGDKIIEIGSAFKCPLEHLPLHLQEVEGIVGPNLSRFDLLTYEEKEADAAHLVALAYKQLCEGIKPVCPLYLSA